MRWVELPKRLVIVNGEIIMLDGSDLRKYLQEWQIKNNIEDGEHVVIHTRDSAVSLLEENLFALAG